MSRCYRMEVEVTGIEERKCEAIKAAAATAWPFTDWDEDEEALGCSAEGCLCGGESEEEFAERLTVAIWRANGGYCEVLITASYLDIEPPWEEHHLVEEDYDRLIDGGVR